MGVSTLTQEVTERLIEDIRSDVFPAGTRLPTERELMSHYSVGRNTLREAVRGAVALGLLDVRAGVGTTVTRTEASAEWVGAVAVTLSRHKEVEDLLEFRLLLESDAAWRAAERAQAEDLRLVRRALTDYQNAVRYGADVYARDVAFHRAVASATHNRVFLQVIDTTAQLLESAMREANRAAGDVSAAAAEHALIAHYVLLGDAQASREAMRTHLLAANERRLRNLDPASTEPEA